MIIYQKATEKTSFPTTWSALSKFGVKCCRLDIMKERVFLQDLFVREWNSVSVAKKLSYLP